MTRCSHCERSISFWRIRCQVCKSYNWRLPHIIFSAVLCLVVLGGSILAIDHLVYSKQVTPASSFSKSQPAQNEYRPQ